MYEYFATKSEITVIKITLFEYSLKISILKHQLIFYSFIERHINAQYK